jgi:hypothetical protein
MTSPARVRSADLVGQSSAFDGLTLVLTHVVGVSLDTQPSNVLYAGGAIGAKQKRKKDLCNKGVRLER